MKQKFKQLLKWESYENILVGVLKFFLVRPYFFLKAHKKWRYATAAGLVFVLAGGFFLLRNAQPTEAGWWNDSWSYRKQLVIDSDQVAGDLTNFPILVSITDTDLIDKAQDDGDDLVFTLSNGTKLSHEIESFNSTTGALVAWVRIPDLSGSSDTALFIYYGNATAQNQQMPAEVWDDNYVGVWHLSEHVGSPGVVETDSVFISVQMSRGDSGPASWNNGLADNVYHYDGSGVTIQSAHGVNGTGIEKGSVGSWNNSVLAMAGLLVFSAENATGTNRVQSASYAGRTVTASSTFLQTPVQGNLLVAISSHRNDGITPSISGSGWNLALNECYAVSGGDCGPVNTSHRRGMAVWWKIAGGSEPTTIETSWSPSTENTLLIQEFEISGNTSFSFDSSTYNHSLGVGVSSLSVFGVVSTVEDSTSNGNQSSVRSSLGTTGKISGAYGFDGVSSLISVPDSPSTSIEGDEFTLSAWAYPTNIAGDSDSGIISKGPSINTERYHLGINSNGSLNARRFSGSLERLDTTGGDVTENQWQYLVGRYDGATLKAYANGVEKGSTPASGDISSTSSDLLFGKRHDNRVFTGRIDEIRISKTARSADWIATEYANQNDPATFLSMGSEEVGPGPVGYWSFDEGYGATAHDNSGQGNDGTITGAVWQDESQCVSGKCLWFDGEDQTRVEISEIPGYLTSFTYCTWLKASALVNSDSDSSMDIMNKGHKLSFNNSGRLMFYVRTNNAYPTSYSQNNIEANKWYHVCGVSNGIGAYPDIFVNGEDETDPSSTGTGIVQYTNNLQIGADAYNVYNSNFHGYLDEVKIYPYARTANEIKADFAAGQAGMKSNAGISASFGGSSDKWMSDGLVGYWKMDESSWNGTSGEVLDASGNANHGTAVADATTTAGKFGNGGTFDGTGDYVSVNDNLDFGNNSFSVFGWAKITEQSTGRSMAGKLFTSSSDGFSVDITSTELLQCYTRIDGSTLNLATTHNLSVGWHYIGCIRDVDRDLLVAYADGAEVGSVADTRTGSMSPGTGEENLRIGGFWSSDPMSYSGQIDEVRVYNRALDPREVKKLYQWAPGPVAHWKMDEKVAGDAQTIYDTSGNENHGTTVDGANNTGMDCTKPGKYGTACEFDGTDDSVVISGFSSLGAQNYSFWLHPNVVSDSRMILNFENTFVRTWNNTNIQFGTYCSGAASMKAGGPLAINDWNHVAISWNGQCGEDGSVTFVINGKSSTQTGMLSGEPPSSNPSRYIGYAPGAVFPGLIDDVRIYNYALDQKQIVNVMNGREAHELAVGSPIGHPVASWKFDEGVGVTAYDEIGDNDGTLTPGTGGGNDEVSEMWSLDGKLGKAIEFDGTDDHVSVAHDSALDLGQDMSIVFWFSKSSWTSSDSFLSKGAAYLTQRYDIYTGYSDGDISFLRENDNDEYDVTINSADYYDGDWTFVAAIAEDGDLKLSVGKNGSFTTEVGGFNYTWDTGGTNDLVIGAFGGVSGSDPSDFIEADIDEVQIYNYALSDEEVKAVYNQSKTVVMGSSGTDPATGNPTRAESGKYCVPGDTSPCDPPVLELDFDEREGTTAFDKSGNGNDGTLGGDGLGDDLPVWDPLGHSGPALSFDGVDDYVSQPDAPFLAAGDVGTVEMWLKTDDTSSTRIAWSTMEDRDRVIYIQGSTLNACVAYSGDVLTGATLDDEWHHVVFSWNNSSGKQLYLDGKLIDSTTQSWTTSGSEAPRTYLGRMDSGVGHACEPAGDEYNWDGLIDQFILYDYARTPAQIAWDYNKGAPVGWWKMDEADGTTVADWSGNENHGTMTNMDPATDRVEGKFGKALDFEDTDDYVDLGAPSELSLSQQDHSVAMWVNLDKWLDESSGYYSRLFFNRIDADDGFFLISGDLYDLPDDQINYVVYDGGTRREVKATNLSLGTWYHCVGVYDSSSQTVTLYINGVAYTTTDTSDATLGSVNGLNIGRRTDGYGYTDGLIDDVRIYNYALTPNQIKDVYNNGAVSFR